MIGLDQILVEFLKSIDRKSMEWLNELFSVVIFKMTIMLEE